MSQLNTPPRFFSLFDGVCLLCDDHCGEQIALCKPCQNDLPRIQTSCRKCGVSINHSDDLVCGECQKAPLNVDYTVCLFHYEAPVDYLIGALKFKQQLACAAVFSHLLIEKLTGQTDLSTGPEVIIPVPLFNKRLVKRGFNQSLEIARPLAHHFNIPIDNQLVRRHKATLAQSTLNRQQRKKNIKGCFTLTHKPPYNHVVLVDDVITTGATVNEIATVLKQAGVAQVGVWSVARAELK